MLITAQIALFKAIRWNDVGGIIITMWKLQAVGKEQRNGEKSNEIGML